MGTATVLSAMFLQKQQQAAIVPLKFFFSRPPSSRCCWHNGSMPKYASLQRFQSDGDGPKKNSSRRDLISLFVQISVLCSPVCRHDAHAAERVESFEHSQFKKQLEMETLSETASARGSNRQAGYVLAYSGRHEGSSGSSMGLLGCLVFGLLFLKERQRRTSNDASLEDVELRLKKADADLCFQTRSSVRWKMENSQPRNDNVWNISLDESLLQQLVNARSKVAEIGTRLNESKRLSESFRERATGLTASLKEVKKECSSLMEELHEELDHRKDYEAEFQSRSVDLQLRIKEINDLNAAWESIERAYTVKNEELVAVESSLDKAVMTVQEAEVKVKMLGDRLLATGDLNSLAKELNMAVVRNQKLEVELCELSKRSQDERASYSTCLSELNELVNIKRREADALTTELNTVRNVLERNAEAVCCLTSERDEVTKAANEIKLTTDNLVQLLNSAEKSFGIYESDLVELQKELHNEQIRTTALRQGELSNLPLMQLLKASSEVQEQINAEKEKKVSLVEELHVAQRALSSSKVEVSTLQDKMKSILASQAQLEEDFAKVREAQEACTLAIRKEKRAAAYAKKMLVSCKGALAEDKVVADELRADLEKMRRLVQDLKEQALFQTSKLEREAERAIQLAQDVASLKAVLEEEPQKPLDKCDQVVTPVGKTLCRTSVSKQTMPKPRKKSRTSSVFVDKMAGVHNNGNALVDDRLGSSISG